MEMKIEPLALPGVDTQRPIVIAGPCSAEALRYSVRVFGSLVRNRVDSRGSEPRDWLG